MKANIKLTAHSLLRTFESDRRKLKMVASPNCSFFYGITYMTTCFLDAILSFWLVVHGLS